MDDEFLEVCFRGNNRGVELLLRIILDNDEVRNMSKVFAAFGEEIRKRSIAIGKERGIEQTKLAFVSSMLANGCSHEDIARLTSLPLAEVQALARRQGQTGGHS